jgi:8-oxo-dGTP pyrophosphatase MutT (NUDIX family)
LGVSGAGSVDRIQWCRLRLRGLLIELERWTPLTGVAPFGRGPGPTRASYLASTLSATLELVPLFERLRPIADAAARELAEEADLVAAHWQLITDVHTSPGCSNEVIRLFLARGLSDVPAALRHRREHEEAELSAHRVPLDDAVDMVLRGEITNAAAAVGLLAAVRLRDRGWPVLRPLDVPLPPRRR